MRPLLWPAAPKNYINLKNSLPSRFILGGKKGKLKLPEWYDRSPISRLSGTEVEANLYQFHPFGSPVYVLENSLQSQSVIINGQTELVLEFSCATLLITPPVCHWSSILNQAMSCLSSTAYTITISTPASNIQSFNPFGNQNPNFNRCPNSPPPLMYSPLTFMIANPTFQNLLTRCHIFVCHGMLTFQSKHM